MSRGDEKMAGYFKAPGVKRNITRNFEMRKGCIVFFHSFYVMFSFQLGCVGWTQWKWHVLGITGHEVLTKSDAREMRPLLEVPSWQLLDAALSCHNKTCHFSCDCRELAYRLCHYVLWKMISSHPSGGRFFSSDAPRASVL